MQSPNHQAPHDARVNIPPMVRAQVLDVHPGDKDTPPQVSVMLENMGSLQSVRVGIAGNRRHNNHGSYFMPEKTDWGIVLFPSNQISEGVWLCALDDIGTNIIPHELLTGDPIAVLEHHPNDITTIHHGDGSLEQTFPDGSLFKITAGKDGSPGNPSKREAKTPRFKTKGARGYPLERVALTPKTRPPVDVVFKHVSGATVSITADGSFNLETPHGHKLRLFDATEHGRSSTTGAITSTPDPTRATSEVTLESEQGHKITLHDTPSGTDRFISVRSSTGLELKLADTPNAKATLTTPEGRSVTLDDSSNTTTIHDPAKIILDSPLVEMAGGGSAVARVGDAVNVTLNVDNTGAFGAVVAVTVASATISAGSAKVTSG